MSRKPADLSGITAKKGEASSATPYIGDDKPSAPPPVQTAAKTPARTKAKTPAKASIPEHLRIEKPEPRRDALNIRITATERQRIEAICDRLGTNITQTLMFGLAALERELGE